MQEMQIYDNNKVLIFTGYLENCNLPELDTLDKIQNELNLTLMTPRALTTKKVVTVITTDYLSNILNRVLQPLFDEGYTLKEVNFEDKAITVKFISRTIQDCLNILSTNYSLYWNINELKEITINSIDYQFNKNTKKTINIENYREELKGLYKLAPFVEGTDYANIINIKNARIFYSFYNYYSEGLTLTKDDNIVFENPIDISYQTALRINAENYFDEAEAFVTNLWITYTQDGIAKDAYILSAINSTGEYENGINIKDIGTDTQDEAEFILERDSMFTNLVTGITYKGNSDIKISRINTQTALRYATMKLFDWNEIEKMKETITKTGQIEKVIDVNEKWFTEKELVNYIRSVFKDNKTNTNKIKIYCDENNKIEIGDKLEIDLEELYTKGNYIVTDITISKEGNNNQEYIIELRNTALKENYADLFQNIMDTEEQENQEEVEYIVEYAEEEVISEVHEIEYLEGG